MVHVTKLGNFQPCLAGEFGQIEKRRNEQRDLKCVLALLAVMVLLFLASGFAEEQGPLNWSFCQRKAWIYLQMRLCQRKARM